MTQPILQKIAVMELADMDISCYGHLVLLTLTLMLMSKTAKGITAKNCTYLPS
jgi:hypothetical protein